jgi:monoamine oxidase
MGIIIPDNYGINMLEQDRKSAIIAQVKRLYGWQANEFKYYGEINWAYESFTSNYTAMSSNMDEHPIIRHPILQQPMMNGRLFWGSSEVSTVSGGYVAGAVYRANEITEAIIKNTKMR